MSGSKWVNELRFSSACSAHVTLTSGTKDNPLNALANFPGATADLVSRHGPGRVAIG